MKDFVKKYGSRKFILTLLTDILLIANILSGYGGKLGMISSIIAIVVTTAIYIINESKIDIEAVQKIIQLSIDDYKEIKSLVENYNQQEQMKKETIEKDVK